MVEISLFEITASGNRDSSPRITLHIGDRSGEGSTLGKLGNAYAALGEVDKAISNCEQALVIAREIGDRRHGGNRLGNLDTAYEALGEVDFGSGKRRVPLHGCCPTLEGPRYVDEL